ncbi:hypothetical protein CANARDRAFT_26558 [[Candida] arabinofermentans NRRL YB-2248]|uniref:Major facilitator superfamily (MFS) profile domain-containing protein n=1 Tax=[Candida] arabinofermentans NRRL YB-2248 TaxID=983967 RepID=A0A1E4T5W7_9ASCO|nr:hypothetical protein CANARDRAFT_26558 [[Candida] arabinofermentans NRRL YB-2248]
MTYMKPRLFDNTPNETPGSTDKDDYFQITKDESLCEQTEANLKNTDELETKPSYLGVSLLCCLVAVGGYVFGWDIGTISGFVGMSDFKQRFGQVNSEGEHYLSNIRTGLIVAIFNMGCAIGGLTLGRLGDIYGRKKGLIITMIVYVVGITIQIASGHSWVQYFIGRIIAGLAVGSISVLCPLFISETSPKEIRGTLVSVYQLLNTMAIFVGYCATYATYHEYNDSRQWRIPLGLGYAWAIIMVGGMLIMPESPRYLVEVGNIEKAMKSVAKVNNVPINSKLVTSEIELIANSVEAERDAGDPGWGYLITGQPKILYRVFIGVMLQSLQQLTGCNYFFYYGTTIFKSVGLEDSYETSIILGTVNFVSTFLSLYIIDRLGRRMCLLGGSIAMSICLIIFSSIGTKSLYPTEYGVDANQATGNVMILFACLFIFFFATTWAPGVFVVVSETYPLKVRAKAMAVSSAANWTWNFLIAFFTPLITDKIHFAYGFVFCGCTIFSIFFVFAFVPETKGLTLESVDELYLNYTPGLAFITRKKDGDVEKL